MATKRTKDIQYPTEQVEAKSKGKAKAKAVANTPKPQPAARKPGRPEFVITDEVIKQAMNYAALGMNTPQIAAAMGVGKSTLLDKMARYPELQDAVKEGKAKGIARVVSKLMHKIDALDTGAIIFYLKTQAGWREQPTQVALTDSEGNDKKVPTLADLYGVMAGVVKPDADDEGN